MTSPFLQLKNVSVTFPIYQGGSRSLKKRILFSSSAGQIAKGSDDRITVDALRNVSLNLNAGDRVALIGNNGAGKTTLLRVMAEIYEPHAGWVRSQGRISPMFDIGLGIDTELNGLENIRLRGRILGLTKEQIDQQLDEIAEFSELGDHLLLPVRTYSSGMITRLTFAAATCFAPEILLMDEWIVAGDTAFVAKANVRANRFIANASILVLASHSTEICKQWCNKAVWMDRGTVREFGAIDNILDSYATSSR